MKDNSNNVSVAIPTLKDALKLIGFKEIASNVYSIPPKKRIQERKN